MALVTAAHAGPISISAEPIPAFQRLSEAETFGPFAWRGGLTLASPDKHFGGLSGLVLGPDCESLVAVSDAGNWLEARLVYDRDRLTGLSGAHLSPMLDSKGRPLRTKVKADAEAVARLGDGRLLAAFESLVRFGHYDLVREGTKARFRAVPHPKDIDTGPDNGEVEAVGELPDGRLLAIAEGKFDPEGRIRAWAWKGERTTPFTLEPFGDYRVTDLAVLKDGSVLTLERRFTATSLPGMAVRRFPASAIAAGETVMPELLLEATAPLTVIDNMEGIALCERAGETRVTLLSDDNFNSAIQSTVLLQFAYTP
jgi:hypothetical protein